MSEAPRDGRHNLGFLLIVGVFLLTAGLYAVYTPTWQNPDEPAHYNYIRDVWERGEIPVLQAGDYPHEYLEQIKARRFPPDMPIDPIRMEGHQPPLYYLLAAPVYGLAQGWTLDGRVLALRLLSVVLGAAFLWVTFRIVRLAFPEERGLALLAVAFAATIPMQVAISAAVNNDALANLLLAGAVALMLAAVRQQQRRTGSALRWWVLAGAVLGLGMLTKTTAYVGIVIGAAILLWQLWKKQATGRTLLAYGSGFLGPAFLLNLPWYVRNVLVYGGTDILGLQRHNAIVVGQPRTADWLAQVGWGAAVKDFITTTFRSFWAQFGWMGILVDQRIYQGLALLSGLLFLGLLLYLLRAWANRYLISRTQWMALGVLGFWVLSSAAVYLWYNVQFVQHQGRYLFPALPAIAVGLALGFRETLRPTRAPILAALCSLGIVISLALILLTGRAFRTLTLLLGLGALAYVLVAQLGPRRTWLWQVGIYVALVGLDLACLFRFIVPAFGG